MNKIETIISDYINQYGTNQEKEVHEIYKGNYLTLFSIDDNDLEESVEFGGSEVFIFGVLVFILETVGKSIVKDGYKLSKEKILEYLKKNRNEIQKESKPKEIVLTEKTIKELITLLQKELDKNMPNKEL